MNILDKIVEEKKQEVQKLKSNHTPSGFGGFELFGKKCIPVVNNIESGSFFLIAEVKKASPSKGLIAPGFDPLRTAQDYLRGGADAISVLTDEKFFMGSPKYLEAVSLFSEKPVLRKDFIIDPLQVYESKAIGADFILLIASILSKNQLAELSQLSSELGMETLVEIHSTEEAEKIDFTLNPLIGVNSRNLKTFKTSLDDMFETASSLPGNVKVIAESGVSSLEDIRKISASSFIDGALIGEFLMRSRDKQKTIKEIKNAAVYAG